MAIMHVYWQGSNQQMPCDRVQARFTKAEVALLMAAGCILKKSGTVLQSAPKNHVAVFKPLTPYALP